MHKKKQINVHMCVCAGNNFLKKSIAKEEMRNLISLGNNSSWQ